LIKASKLHQKLCGVYVMASLDLGWLYGGRAQCTWLLWPGLWDANGKMDHNNQLQMVSLPENRMLVRTARRRVRLGMAKTLDD
jgi:hypothetical protein